MPPPTRVGPWSIIRDLGGGGMGLVYLAKRADGRVAALKLIRTNLADPTLTSRFAAEARSLATVSGRSPHLPTLIDFDLGADPAFIAQEYIEGDSCADLMRLTGPWSNRPDEVLMIAVGVARALAALSSFQIRHRDVKPSNVMFVPQRGAVLIDMGIAVADGHRDLTSTGAVIGSKGYVAPEVLLQDEPTEASDVFGWAVTVAEFANGARVFGPAAEANRRIIENRATWSPWRESGQPRELVSLVASALAPSPSTRPPLARILATLEPMLATADEQTVLEELGETQRKGHLSSRYGPPFTPRSKPGPPLGFFPLDEDGPAQDRRETPDSRTPKGAVPEKFDPQPRQQPTAANAPCPCGSGRQYNNCHGAGHKQEQALPAALPRERALTSGTQPGRRTPVMGAATAVAHRHYYGGKLLEVVGLWATVSAAVFFGVPRLIGGIAYTRLERDGGGCPSAVDRGVLRVWEFLFTGQLPGCAQSTHNVAVLQVQTLLVLGLGVLVLLWATVVIARDGPIFT